MDFVKPALRYITKDEKICIELQDITSQSMQERRQHAEEELENVWEDERAQPVTYNHYYTDNVQKARYNRIEKAIEGPLKNSMSLPGKNGRSVLSSPNDDIARLLATLTKSVNVDMDDQACTEALIDLGAYYKVCIL